MSAFGIGEINVICSDLDRSLRFYRDVCGFTVEAFEGRACHLRCGPHRVLLLPVAREAGEPVPYGSRPTISFDLIADDIAEAARRFAGHGAEFAMPWEPGAVSFHVRDPDGLVLEVIDRAALSE